MQLIKYFLIFIMGVILSFIFVFSRIGAGLSDWEYKLPNDYEVWHMNSEKIAIVGSVGIPSFVKEFSYNDRYVFTRNTSDIVLNNMLEDTYYILDTKEKAVYGPLESVSEIKQKAKELHTVIPDKWYRTDAM